MITLEIFYITLLTLLASTIGTITGFGTSTIMIPVLVMFLPPVEAIFLVAIIHWFGDVWKISLFHKGFNLKLITLFGVIGLLTSYIGASVSLGADKEILLRFLGLFLAGYAIFLVLQSKFKVRAGNITALSGGALSGFFAGMFGIGGAIRSMFLSAFDLPKEMYIATAGAIGIMVDATRIITYFTGGTTLPNQLWWSLLILIPVSFSGAQIAKRIVDRIPQEKFRGIIAVFLLVIAVKLIVLP
ncbi:MAG: sulfite exporter TauE/SafE family protein [Deltaproteobacteria bacterium]|nr:sulfite exporter TauE/SafE family protein [Deltaproteobacteria bacterium]